MTDCSFARIVIAMLKLWTYTDRRQIEQKCEEVDFQNETWILPDLRSKIELQRRLFLKYGYTLDQFVMRASDFWKTLLRKARPEIEIVSRDYAGLMAKNFLKELPAENPLFLGLTESAWMDQLNRWSSVAFSETLQDELTQYLELNLELKNRIAQDFYFAKILALFFGRQKKIIASWIPALLQEQLNLPQFWNRPLWVDLRGEMSLSEAELFQRFSQLVDVNVLVPNSEFEKEYPSILKPYEYLYSKAKAIQALSHSPAPLPPFGGQKIFGFSGPLAEVKAAVAQVRQWLEEGISPQEIGLLAPDIESYWPCLSSYLQIEGIPVQKAMVSRLMTFPSVRLWMAKIRASMNAKDYFSLEKVHFEKVNFEKKQVRFEEFRALLYEIYEEHDLKRIQSVFQEIQRAPVWPRTVTRDEFLARALGLWEMDRGGRALPPEVKGVLEKFLREASISDESSPTDWFKFLESIIGQTEIRLSEGQETGLSVSSLMSGWASGLKKIILFGVSDESLKSYSRLGLSPMDTRQLSQDLGLVIESSEKNHREYELRWWLTDTEAEIEIYEPLTDWQGQLLNHTAFLLSREKLRKQTLGLQTCWDQIQSLGLEESLEYDLSLDAAKVKQKIREDLGVGKSPLITGWSLQELSPSSIESYLKCPFVFFANKGFRLLDMDDVDLDLDLRQSGRFYHAVVEALLDPNRNLDWSEGELRVLIEDLKNQHLMILDEDQTWPPRRTKFVKWSQHFLDFEREWLKSYPNTHVFGRETPWRSAWVTKSENLGAAQGSGVCEFIFRGKIDRLDTNDQGQAVVIDYKSSAAGKTGPKSWLVNNELQMLFYIWALRAGAVAGLGGEVLGAFYYDLKKLDRSKGFQLREESTILPALARKNSGTSREELEALMSEFQGQIDHTLVRMRQGNYRPEPEDEKECLKCRWSQICRAPHLN